MNLSRFSRETLVGAAIVAVATAFIIFSFTGGGAGHEGYPLRAKFRQVDGLSLGSPVHLAGIRIGEVTGMEFETSTNQAVVTFHIADTVRLSEDSSAQVVTDGLLGQKFLKLVPGGADEIIAPGGRIIYIQNGLIVERLLDSIVRNAEGIRRKRLQRSKDCKCGGAGESK
ncbi:MAG: outer membrane lipid asymmetry maintenance protein MlaD [Alphaproteobacteria bacterium]